MDQTTDRTEQAVAVDLARRTIPLWQSALGSDLLGVYLMGSLAHGGFSRRYSDVDIAVVTEAALSPQVIDRVRSEATASSAEWGPKLSVFWADRRFSLGRLPPLDRIDYLDHAVALTERERVRPARPSLEEIQRYLAGAPFENWRGLVRHFATAEMLEPKDRKAYLRTILYPARFCYSWLTGRMGSNDDAVSFLANAAPAGVDMCLMTRALQCRQSNADPDSLFAQRTELPLQVRACAALVANPASTG